MGQNYNKTLLTFLTVWALSFIGVCANLFAFSIFDLRKAAIISKIHYSITPVCVGILSLLYLITSNYFFIILWYSFTAFSLLVFIIVLIKLVIINKNFRNRGEKIVLAAFSIFIISGIVILTSNSTFPPLFGCIIFAFALADHFNGEHKDLKNLKHNLEKKIKQRTEQLVKANEQLVKANEKLKTLDKSKDILIANISHEFRTPLTLIRTPVDAIIHGKFGTTINIDDKLFSMILGNTNKLMQLISNLLDFSKIGLISLKKQKINIVKIIRQYVTELDSAFAIKNIKLHFSSTEESIILDIDQHLFESAVSNLLSNAFKFTPQNGSVSICCETNKEKKQFSLSVADSGIGIPLEELPLVFDRFYQATQYSNQKNEGTGIGLALVKEIIERHDGSISIHSEVSKGTTFTIKLPYLNIKTCRPQNYENVSLICDAKDIIQTDEIISFEQKSFNCAAKERILLVEDSIPMQFLLVRLLNDKYNIYCAENGKDALELLEKGPKPNLIISDVMMPVMDGTEFHNTLSKNKKHQNIPFLFLTARADQEEKEFSLEQGAFDYIYKPFAIKELEAKIRNLIKWDKQIKDHIQNKIINNLADIVTEDGTSVQFMNGKRKQILENHKISLREAEIIEYIFQGLQDKQIASQLSISTSTVSNHVRKIYLKLNVNSRTELMSTLMKE